MTNDERPNDEGNPNDECRMFDVADRRTNRRADSSFELRHSFVIGYFVIRH